MNGFAAPSIISTACRRAPLACVKSGTRISINRLRRQLQEMTANGKPSSHPAIVEQLRADCAHTLEVLTDGRSNLAFNCVMHAFGIETDADYFDLARACLRLDPRIAADPDYQGVHADTAFVEFLIRRNLIAERPRADQSLLTVYYTRRRVTHIGRLVSPSRLVSKWGIGHLYEHALDEVPSSYGSTVRYFTSRPSSQIVDDFFDYAISCGIPLR